MSGRVNVLGIAGTVQTGKSELAPVFAECGWKFLDLNDPQCDLRAKGTARYDLYMSRFPGCLKECGSKTGDFYDLVDPAFYMDRVREDMNLLVPVVLDWCKQAAPLPVALSWEYLPFIADRLPLDHTLLFVSNEQVWMERLHARLKSRGVQGEVTDDRIRKVLDMLDVWPDKIKAQVEEKMAGKFSTFDVSPADWGAEQLRVWLQDARN